MVVLMEVQTKTWTKYRERLYRARADVKVQHAGCLASGQSLTEVTRNTLGKSA